MFLLSVLSINRFSNIIPNCVCVCVCVCMCVCVLFDCYMETSVQFSSIAQSCPTLCDPMNRSTPGLPVDHQLWSSCKLMSIELMMPSSHLILCHPLLLLPPIPPRIRVFSNESTLRMRWQSTGVSDLASFLPNNTQDWSPSEWTDRISLQSKGLSRVFFNTTVQKHQFFGAQVSFFFFFLI